MVPARKSQNWLPSIFNEFFGNEWMDCPNASTAPGWYIIENDRHFKV